MTIYADPADLPLVINGQPVDADAWYNSVRRILVDGDLVGKPRGVLARGKRTTSSTGTTTETGVLRLPGVSVGAGRLLRVWSSNLILASTVANDSVRAIVRYTTDGSTPTTASTQLGAIQMQVPNTSFPPTQELDLPFPVGGSDLTLAVLLTVARQSGTGSVSLLAAAGFDIDLVVEDVGADPGDLGVDL